MSYLVCLTLVKIYTPSPLPWLKGVRVRYESRHQCTKNIPNCTDRTLMGPWRLWEWRECVKELTM